MFEKECSVVAEIGANHNQDFATAVKLILAAKWAGADAVKVQMFRPDDLTIDSDASEFQIAEGPWAGSLYKLYQKACMPYEWIPTLKAIAEDLGLFFFTTIYHPRTVEVAEEWEIPAYKISSFEITYLELIEAVAKTKKPLIISLGTAEFTQMWAAIKAIRPYHKNFWLLHCLSKYPARPEELNLRTIYDISRYCHGQVGLSDHTLSTSIPAVAASMDARIIEKHLKISNDCLDAEFSLWPHEFAQMVKNVHEARKALGSIKYGITKQFQRKLFNGRMVRTVR